MRKGEQIKMAADGANMQMLAELEVEMMTDMYSRQVYLFVRVRIVQLCASSSNETMEVNKEIKLNFMK